MAHAVGDAAAVELRGIRRWISARVFWRGFEPAMDAALLELPITSDIDTSLGSLGKVHKGKDLGELWVASPRLPQVSEAVSVVGFPVFSPLAGHRAMQCDGIVTQVTKHDSRAVLMSVSAPIYRGSSGAPIFASDGSWCGMAVAHVRWKSSSSSASSSVEPRLNLCLPAVALTSLLEHLRSGQDPSLWQLSSAPAVNQLWQLKFPEPKKQDKFATDEFMQQPRRSKY